MRICNWKLRIKEILIRDYFQGINDSKREGVIEGKAIGLTEGERKTKVEIARNLLAQGYSTESILKATGLSIDEIIQL